MIQIMLYIMTFISSVVFMQMNHPLAMGLMLLIQSFLVCLITWLMYNSFLYSYILFLVFLGGYLILFIYVTSLASNEMFTFSMKIFIKSMIVIIISFIFSMLIDNSMINVIFESDNMTILNNKINMIQSNSISLMKLYNFPTNLITILLMNYLLLTLNAVVKITNLFYGPLRTMN